MSLLHSSGGGGGGHVNEANDRKMFLSGFGRVLDGVYSVHCTRQRPKTTDDRRNRTDPPVTVRLKTTKRRNNDLSRRRVVFEQPELDLAKHRIWLPISY